MKKNGGALKTMKVVGHRGARGLAPENTIASIQAALRHKVDEIEIDVRVTKDKVAVLNHNSYLRDQTYQRFEISNHTYDELKQHKPDLATLEEAIAAVGRKVPLQIEVKWGEPTTPVVRVIQVFLTQGWLETDFLIGSKKQQTLMSLHQSLPAIPTVVIEPFSGLRATWRARQIGTKRISMRSWWLWSGFINMMNKSGYELYAYTLNNPAKARRWAREGMTGVITDYPDAYRRKL